MTFRISFGLLVGMIALAILAGTLLCDSREDNGLRREDYARIMENFRYAPVSASETPELPDSIAEVIGETIETAISAVGEWSPGQVITPEDTVSVEVSMIELDDGSQWVKATIDGDLVKWERATWFEEPETRPWKLQLEVSDCPGNPWGIGIGYQVTEILGVGIVPSVVENIELQWTSIQVKFSRNIWSGVSFDGGFGRRFFQEPGWTFSGGISVSL